MSKNRGKKIVEEEEPEEEEEVEEEEEDEDEEEEEAPKAKPKAGSKATPTPKRAETKEDEDDDEEEEEEEEEEDQSSRRGASAARGSGLTQILPYLYVGDANTCKRSDVLKGQGITHIVNCISNEVPNQHPDEFHYTEFEIDDDRNYKISHHFEETFELFAEARDSNGKHKVLVFCEKGTGPSCVLVLAYMLRSAKQKRKPLTLKAAHTYVKGKKPNMWINDGFLRQLINLEKELFGDSTMRVHNAGGKGRRGEKRTVKLDQ